MAATLGVGTQDALVIDTFATGPPKHAERYFYVYKLGRVVEASSTYDSNDGYYDSNPKWSVHDYLRPFRASIMPINGSSEEPSAHKAA